MIKIYLGSQSSHVWEKPKHDLKLHEGTRSVIEGRRIIFAPQLAGARRQIQRQNIVIKRNHIHMKLVDRNVAVHALVLQQSLANHGSARNKVHCIFFALALIRQR